MIRGGWMVTAAGLLCLVAGGCSPGAADMERPTPVSAATVGPLRAAATWSPPPVNATVDYQLGGAYPPPTGVTVVTRDREAPPASNAFNICYVNAFQTQAGERSFWLTKHPTLVLRDSAGKPVEDAGWPGEYLLDISTAAKRERIAAVIGAWFTGCARSGYRAVEPDNLDSWTRSNKLLTQAQAVAMSELLIGRAHQAGLAIAQKNAAELDGRRLGFDFAVAEECEVYDECDRYTKSYGRHVIEIEYSDTARRYFDRACRLRGSNISILWRDRDVLPRGTKGYAYSAC